MNELGQEPALRLLAIESSLDVQHELRAQARDNGWQVKMTSRPERAFDILSYYLPDLILLDLLTIDYRDHRFTLNLQARSSAPVILLVEEEKVEQLGRIVLKFTDFLCKPISWGELKFRVETVLERSEDDHLVYGPIYIDQNHKQVHISGHELALTPKEYLLLRMLVQVRGRPLPIEKILASVWPQSKRASASDVHQYIHHLRQKIKAQVGFHDCIYFDRGLGYHLNCFQCQNRCSAGCPHGEGQPALSTIPLTPK